MFKNYLLSLLLMPLLAACSCINSLTPFDQKQARILLEQEYQQKYGRPLPDGK